jgi:hypothetical protein
MLNAATFAKGCLHGCFKNVGRAASLPVRVYERAFQGKLAAYPTQLAAY